MLKILVGVFIGTFFFTNPIQGSYVPPPILEKPQIHELIVLNAKRYGVAESTLRKVIKCESGFKEKAVGDGGTSFGLSQINLPSHPYVTRAEAWDREFAIDFLAKGIANGQGKMWTCWRQINGMSV